MQTINIDEIVVAGDRQRSQFDEAALERLAASIVELGQLQNIVLEDDGRTLRAGERRLRAVRLIWASGRTFVYDGKPIPHKHIGYTCLRDMTDAEKYKVELEENIQRVDISWQDKVRAIAKLQDLYEKQTVARGERPTMQGFATEVKGPSASPAAVDYFRTAAAEAVNVAKYLDDPAVATAKTRKEAEKIVKRKQTQELQIELQRKLAASGYLAETASPHTLLHGSAFTLAPTLPAGFFDVIITDPPYGIDMDQMTTQSGSSSGHTHDYKDSFEYAKSCVELVAHEGFRVARASAHCYMFCDGVYWPAWKQLFEQEGWYVWPQALIWDKRPTGNLLGEANGPRHVYETILYAIKGRRAVNSVGTDIISVPGPSADKRHPAEKPVDLYAHLLSLSALPGDKVLDFFCGCGPIFPAATQYQCFATGIEYAEQHHASASLRIHSMLEIL